MISAAGISVTARPAVSIRIAMAHPRVHLIVLAAVASLISGCVTPVSTDDPGRAGDAQQQALETLKAALAYPHNPVVRAEAVEALEGFASPEVLPWVRTALSDEHPGVRFAACVAVGMRRDSGAESGVRHCLHDAHSSVVVGAIFALHRMGDTGQTQRIPIFLLHDSDATVRRNAALVLGRIEAPTTVKVLAKAMGDADPGVRHHALEAMARLGSREARQELTFLANSGIGSDEVFALNALAVLRDRECRDLFDSKLERSNHIETQLAAARGLGLLGIDKGRPLALRGLQWTSSPPNDDNDPPAQRVLRVRQLAAAAIGAVGHEADLKDLARYIRQGRDPRVQVAAAKAILEIQSRMGHHGT